MRLFGVWLRLVAVALAATLVTTLLELLPAEFAWALLAAMGVLLVGGLAIPRRTSRENRVVGDRLPGLYAMERATVFVFCASAVTVVVSAAQLPLVATTAMAFVGFLLVACLCSRLPVKGDRPFTPEDAEGDVLLRPGAWSLLVTVLVFPLVEVWVGISLLAGVWLWFLVSAVARRRAG